MAGDQGSVKLTDRYFDEAAQGFLDLEWDPDKMVLFPRRLSRLSVNPKQMQLRVSPIEGRHESMMRALLTMVAGLRRRIRELEALHPELNQKPQETISDDQVNKDVESPEKSPGEAGGAVPVSPGDGSVV